MYGKLGDEKLIWVPSLHIEGLHTSGWVGVSHIEYARRSVGRIGGSKRKTGVTCIGTLFIADIPVPDHILFALGARCFLSAATTNYDVDTQTSGEQLSNQLRCPCTLFIVYTLHHFSSQGSHRHGTPTTAKYQSLAASVGRFEGTVARGYERTMARSH